MSENRVIYEGILEKGFGLMPKLVATDTNLTIEAKAIYGYIASFAGNGEGAFPKVKTMLYHLQISEKRYYKHIQLLIDNGYIEIQKRRRYDKELKKWVADSNLYIVKQIIERVNYNVSDNVNDNVDMNANINNNHDRTIANTTVSQSSHFDSVQNECVQNESVQNGRDMFNNNNSDNKNNNNNNSFSNNSKLVVVDKEKELFDLFKSFKLEKRFMPHSKKLLQDYINKFDLEVFEQVFIAASSESVSKKFAYIKKVFESLEAKNIKTLEEYLRDQKDFKSLKTKKANKENKIKTRYHDSFNEHHKQYTFDEIEDGLQSNQEKKGINSQTINEKLYLVACEDGMDALSNDIMRELVINYAQNNNLEIPK